MKNQVTRKQVKAMYKNIFAVGYCGAQHLLLNVSPVAYNSGVYGWNCDYYNFNGVIICTGYRPHGTNANEITNHFESLARAVYENRGLPYEERTKEIEKIRLAWLDALTEV